MTRLALAAAVALAARPAAIPPAQHTAAAQITDDYIRGHVRFLSDDLLEGRGPATRGDRLAQTYIAAQMEALGLQPGAPDGTFLQPFDVVGVSSKSPAVATFRKDGQTLDLRYPADYIAFSGVDARTAAVPDAEVVFVGYGIVAPEYNWDDFKGADLAGKVLLIMNNDPSSDPQTFAGKTRQYYGRWTYKYEEAARRGAAGAIIIHTEPSAGYKWQVVQSSWSGEQFSLPHEGGPQIQIKGWTTEEASFRIARLGGHDLDALRAAAEKRDFKPVPLGVRLSLALQNEVLRKKTANVIGRLPGRDAALAPQAVIYTAHHDHLGVREASKPGEDVLYNGARDNATGTAGMLGIARAMVSLAQGPRRTVYFAAVAAEEQGLLGSAYLAAHPPVPAGRLAANINIDSMNIWGRTHDVIMVGKGKSSVDDVVQAVATAQGGRRVAAEPTPDKGFFYRSDQFNLAKIGVPAVYLEAGIDIVGKGPEFGRAEHQKHEAEHYHQPSDELRPDWNLEGAIQDAQLLFFVGMRVADAPQMPAWRPGDEFEAARKKAVAEAR